MKRAVMTRPGSIEFRDAPVPEAGEGELLLRVARIGICGSDVHVYHGRHPYTSYPVVQGHEVSAVVEGLGPKATGFAIGDAVTIMPQITCGHCLPCRSGRYHICEELKVMGFQAPGAASEYLAIAASKCLRLPERMSLDEGAMIEPLAVAVHALARGGGAAERGVMVLGAGPIGNLVAQAAKGLGASRVLVTDTSAPRLEVARSCGIDKVVRPAGGELEKAIAETFGGAGAGLVLECAGAEPAIAQAIALARKGSTIVVVGVFGERPRVDLGLVQDRELSLVGTLMYREEDYRVAIDLVTTGKVRLAPLMSAHFPFERYQEAYEFIEGDRDRAMKVLIDVTRPSLRREAP